jgi:hypothetical protein
MRLGLGRDSTYRKVDLGVEYVNLIEPTVTERHLSEPYLNILIIHRGQYVAIKSHRHGSSSHEAKVSDT